MGIDMDKHYYAYLDPEAGMTVVIFATEEEILNDTVTGEELDLEEMDYLRELFDDDGSMTEDYLIATDWRVKQVREVLDDRGYIYDRRVGEIGWG